jgi:hypothetical protein
MVLVFAAAAGLFFVGGSDDSPKVAFLVAFLLGIVS